MLKSHKSRKGNSNESQASVPPLGSVVNLTLKFGIALAAFMAMVLPADARFPDNDSNGQPIQRPDVPSNLQVPNNQVLLLRTLGHGVQIYDCKATATNSKTFAYTFRQPQANLLSDNSKVVGIHGRGPFWASYDGSRTTGTVKATAPSQNPLKDIPLLLLNATSDKGHGIFSQVNFIQRLDTRGGVAPTGTCNPNKKPTIEVPYSVFYYFYGNIP